MFGIKISGILVIVVAVLGLIFSIKQFRKDKLSTRLLFLWLGIWCVMILFSLFPDFLNFFMSFLNMGNRMLFVSLGAIIIIFIILFYITSAISRLNRKLAQIVRKMALLEDELKDFLNKAKE